MRSARPSAIAVLLAALGTTGCVTTQDVNRRYELRASRTLASRHPTAIPQASPDIRVMRVSLVRGHGTAVVVELANRSGRALTDLPVAVGVRAGDRVRHLNRRGGLDYFQTHVAAVGPHATVRWVFTSPRRTGAGRPFAVVGAPDELSPGAAGPLPAVVASPTGTRREVRVRVRNRSDVPQYGLPVYALARRGGRWVAAGRTTVDELDGGASRTLGLRLTGDADGASLRLEALPTIFE